MKASCSAFMTNPNVPAPATANAPQSPASGHQRGMCRPTSRTVDTAMIPPAPRHAAIAHAAGRAPSSGFPASPPHAQ
ncbi:hypothetical protein [Actinomadura madurae]|uniref:hypothetical protein n=1 Tax=Actinomadura madurae TaxID=1993 RepID=UPI0020D24A1F|nr:hypothetical protein [Actinomadura madurae]MCQ0010464.1 hypothetical protein [Actinomadura madurae]